MSQRRHNRPAPRRSEQSGESGEAGTSQGHASHLAPVWQIGSPRFEADAVCPLMPVWPWGGHRGWAYDLVRFMKPGVICELGVHWGTSLFAFAQAVKDAGFESRMIGVDTWAGDGHTGPYGPDVLQAVRTIARDHFAAQKFELLQMTFDQALPDVADASVDLLHIDGFHTYDAVKHDFESWLPKLAPDGIVLLHDVADDTGYGSADYWKELRAKYDGFHFSHSWGLGVVFPKGSRWITLLRAQGIEDKVQLYTYRAELERTRIELRDTGQLAVERMAAIEEMGRVIAEKSRAEWGLDYNVERLQKDLDAAASIATERLAAIQEMGGTIFGLQERERSLAGRVEQLEADLKAAAALAQERLAAIEDMGGKIYNLQEAQSAASLTHRNLAAELAEARRDLASASVLAGERLAAIESMGREIYELQQRESAARAAAEELGGRLAFAEDQLRAASALAVERLGVMEEMGRTIYQTEQRALAEAGTLREQIREQQSELERLRTLLSEATTWAAALGQELMEKNAMIQELSKSVDDLRADVELLAMRLEHLERIQIEREDAAEQAGDVEPRASAGPEIAPPRRRRVSK